MYRYHSHKLYSKALLFMVLREEIVMQLINQCMKSSDTSYFRTSNVLTAKIMAARKGA